MANSALVSTSAAVIVDEDETKEHLEMYQHLVSLLKLKKVFTARRLLLESVPASSSSYPALPDDFTKQELCLMDAVRSCQKATIENQLVDIALQRSIQSTYLFLSAKNLLRSSKVTYIENRVGLQMKRMLLLSEATRSAKIFTDHQYLQIHKIYKNRSAYDRLYRKLHERMNDDDHKKKELAKKEELKRVISKKIKDLKITTTFIHTIVGKQCHLLDSNDLILKSLEWRMPRTFDYYLNKCKTAE